MGVDPAWEINRRKYEETIVGTLKSGWCLTNHHHICPKKYVDKATPECVCPCHAKVDATGAEIDWSLL